MSIQRLSLITREERLAAFGELSKLPGIKTGTVYADALAGAVELLIPHPMAGRPWRVVGPTDVPGFCHLEFSFSLGRNCEESRVEYTICTLCLPEEQFRRFSSFKPSFPQDW